MVCTVSSSLLAFLEQEHDGSVYIYSIVRTYVAWRFSLHLRNSKDVEAYQIDQDWNVALIQSKVSVGLVDCQAI